MAASGLFVVQHHLATADHFDFRLEIDGVLVSWAVPKGPSTVAGRRRLAKRVEDHDLAHADVERSYDRGRSRVGVVQVWDRGRYDNRSHDGPRPVSAAAGLARGHLSVEVHGVKLSGGFSLLHTEGTDLWLLVKKRDAGATADERSATDLDYSVLSGRSLADIAAAPAPSD